MKFDTLIVNNIYLGSQNVTQWTLTFGSSVEINHHFDNKWVSSCNFFYFVYFGPKKITTITLKWLVV